MVGPRNKILAVSGGDWAHFVTTQVCQRSRKRPRLALTHRYLHIMNRDGASFAYHHCKAILWHTACQYPLEYLIQAKIARYEAILVLNSECDEEWIEGNQKGIGWGVLETALWSGSIYKHGEKRWLDLYISTMMLYRIVVSVC